jgi:copper chaperone NosL
MRQLARALLLVSVAGAMLLAACGGGANGNDPPKIAYGKDTCHRCHMLISEEKFAAGLVSRNGDQSVYDDTGEMIATVQDEGLADRRAWAHDYDSVKWIDATVAWFVVNRDVSTPMGTGVIAFSTQDSAQSFAAAHSGGAVMSWQQLLSHWSIDQ